jgi:hypothetical protein
MEVDMDNESSPYNLPLVSNHTVVRVLSTAAPETELFFQLPEGAEVGDTFELFSINNVQLSCYYPSGESIFGIASVEPYRGVLTIKKVRQGDGVNYESVWLGAQSAKPSWV